MCGTDLAYGPTHMLRDVRYRPRVSCYQGIRIQDMGTKTVANDLDNARVWCARTLSAPVHVICLQARYALHHARYCGTIGFDHVKLPKSRYRPTTLAIPLRARYAMSGRKVAYGVTPMCLLRDVQ
eukprot:576375-Rhodomonas_salina.2